MDSQYPEPPQREEGWSYGRAVCRMCGRREVAVFPVGTDTDNMECKGCRHMTMELEEDPPE